MAKSMKPKTAKKTNQRRPLSLEQLKSRAQTVTEFHEAFEEMLALYKRCVYALMEEINLCLRSKAKAA